MSQGGEHGGRRPGAGRPKGAKSAPADVQTRFAEARAAKEAALAEIRQLEAARKRGETIDKAAAVRSFSRSGMVFRDAMLSIPGRVAAQLATETDERRIEALLTAAIRAELTRLADSVAVK